MPSLSSAPHFKESDQPAPGQVSTQHVPQLRPETLADSASVRAGALEPAIPVRPAGKPGLSPQQSLNRGKQSLSGSNEHEAPPVEKSLHAHPVGWRALSVGWRATL